MPQLIAMVIVVVGAMIYMFQTFGGTGDKIEGVAQKSSVISEINNIRNGLQLALRGGAIDTTPTTLANLATLGYFADQMNLEIRNNIGTTAIASGADLNQNADTYSAISFGGENNPGLFLTLIVGAEGTRPGIRVQVTGTLAGNEGFLESQIANDLRAIAAIDRTTVDGTASELLNNGDVPVNQRPATVVDADGEAGTVAADSLALTDGIFTVYFKDMQQGIVAAP